MKEQYIQVLTNSSIMGEPWLQVVKEHVEQTQEKPFAKQLLIWISNFPTFPTIGDSSSDFHKPGSAHKLQKKSDSVPSTHLHFDPETFYLFLITFFKLLPISLLLSELSEFNR